MRRWVIVSAVLALLAVSVAGVYLWHRHENNIERAVHGRLDRMAIEADWVSCSEDQTFDSGDSLITFYRCDIHGERSDPRIRLKPDASAVCMPFINGRIATDAEAGQIPLRYTFCEGFS